MIAILLTARILGATADLALLASGHLLEALVAIPALLCLSATWRSGTWGRGT